MEGLKDSASAPYHRSAGGPAWTAQTHREKPHLAKNKGWLASLVSSSNQALPVHGNSEKHPWESADTLHGMAAMRLRSMKRNLMRKLPSWAQGDLLRSSLLARPTLSQAPGLPGVIPSPATVRFALLCMLWYSTSALSSNTGKVILTQFRYPITLTFVQFGFVAGYCLLFMSPAVRFSKFKLPSRAIFNSTLPMGCFQVGGHIFSSMAISRIPVSTVHTIKVSISCFQSLLHQCSAICDQ